MRKPNLKVLLRSKAFWTAVTAIVGSIGAAAVGEIPTGQAVQNVLMGLFGIFLRDAVAQGQ
jgi:hypothetical protein